MIVFTFMIAYVYLHALQLRFCLYLSFQDQFVYCHDLLLEYVDSFEGYSNFNE